MSLNINDQRAEKLARDLALETGENITQVIIQSLKERLERFKKRGDSKKKFKDIMSISKRCSSLPDIDKRSEDEILGYNDEGALY